MSALISTSSRQKEILDLLLRHGWGYMQQLLTLGQADRPDFPPPDMKVFRLETLQFKEARGAPTQFNWKL